MSYARPLKVMVSKGRGPLEDPGKHHLHKKTQYQIDEHYDDNHSYSDNDEVSRHLHLLPSLLKRSFAPTNAQNSAKAGAQRQLGPRQSFCALVPRSDRPGTPSCWTGAMQASQNMPKRESGYEARYHDASDRTRGGERRWIS
jgi:hypothetical protein